MIVTSYVFRNGTISFENLSRLTEAVGKDKLVLDLSCRKKDGLYYIVTDRWQTYTKVALSEDILDMLASFCDEFLIHGVDSEGKQSGIEDELICLLSRWKQIPVTYAGGSALLTILTASGMPETGASILRSAARWICLGGIFPMKSWQSIDDSEINSL